MDPFSFAASVLAVVETAGKLIVVTRRYVSEVQEAETSRSHLLQELSALNGSLMSLKFIADSLNDGAAVQGPQTANALSSLAVDGGPLALCKVDLDELLTWLNEDSGTQMKLRQRLLWPLRQKKKIDSYLKKLQRHNSHFTMAISIEQLYVNTYPSGRSL